MGLDFSHCSAHWAYSGFMRFRTRLAAEAVIALHCMEGFARGPLGKQYEHLIIAGDNESTQMPGYSDFISHQPIISWDKVSDDIAPLLNHSDCDGQLTPAECKQVAPRLMELIANWPDDDRDKINALDLAQGMENAAASHENFEFF